MTVCIVYLLTQFKGDTPLIQACGHGRLQLAVLLIEYGAVMDYVNQVRLLYVHCGHGVAQNGVFSLE